MKDKKYFLFSLLLVAILILASIFLFDFPTAGFFYQKSMPLAVSFSKFLHILFLPWLHLILWPTSLFLLCIWRNYSKGVFFLLGLSLSLAVAMAAVEIIKMFLGRARPELFFQQGIYGFTFFTLNAGYFSFPSAHAAVVCCLGLNFFPRNPWLVLLFSLIISISRLILLQHFVSDIIAGVFLAFFITRFVHAKIAKKKALTFSARV